MEGVSKLLGRPHLVTNFYSIFVAQGHLNLNLKGVGGWVNELGTSFSRRLLNVWPNVTEEGGGDKKIGKSANVVYGPNFDISNESKKKQFLKKSAIEWLLKNDRKCLFQILLFQGKNVRRKLFVNCFKWVLFEKKI